MDWSSGVVKPLLSACSRKIFLATGSLLPWYRSTMFCFSSPFSCGASCLSHGSAQARGGNAEAYLKGHSLPRLHSPLTKKLQMCGRLRL